MDLQKIFKYSEQGNLLDGYVHWFIPAFFILALLGLIGLFIGWIMWRDCKRRCAEIEAENARIRAKQSAV